jgi:hypothetical protein
MEIRKVLFRKEMKLVTLLLTSLLIATTSAAVYYSLSMQSTITTATTSVWFEEGVDNATAGVSLNPQKTVATLTGLKAYPNATYTYTDPVRVRNNGSVAYDIRLTPVSLSGNDTEFVFVKFLLRNGTSESSPTLASLNYTCDGSSWTIPNATGWVSIPADEPDTEWAITVITMAKDNAASASVIIEIALDVQ